MAAMTGIQLQCPACPTVVGIPAQLLMADQGAGEAIVKVDTKPLRDHLTMHNQDRERRAEAFGPCCRCGISMLDCQEVNEFAAGWCCDGCEHRSRVNAA